VSRITPSTATLEAGKVISEQNVTLPYQSCRVFCLSRFSRVSLENISKALQLYCYAVLGFDGGWATRQPAEGVHKRVAHIERAWLLAEFGGGRLSDLHVANATSDL